MQKNVIQEKLKDAFAKYYKKVAVEWGDLTLTYGDLDYKSNRIAYHIKKLNIKKGSFIGLMIEDKCELINTIIGILKSGCVFVPLETSYPSERLKSMLYTSQISLLYTDIKNVDRASEIHKGISESIENVYSYNFPYSEIDCMQYLSEIEYGPDDAIYLYFTSGSTGNPKAILGRNKGLLHFLNWEIETLNISEGFRISQFTPQCHDPYLRDIFVPLCCGGTICIPDKKETILGGDNLIGWINERKINLIHCTPSLFSNFNNVHQSNRHYFQELKYILLSGEKVNIKEIGKWYDVFGDRIKLINLYGPTETTLAKLYYQIQPSDCNRNSIPIGKPIKGARAIILDEGMNICNQGAIGNIYIRTPYMSLGYYKNPMLNKEKFIPNPFNNDSKDILYKTGDLGRLLSDGNIEFIGRVDRQIKIRGYRVELDEIESILLSYKIINEAAVVERKNKEGNTLLYSFIVVKNLCNDNKDEIRKIIDNIKMYLTERLPDYMVPQYINLIERMPLNNNGKINYQELEKVNVEDLSKNLDIPRDTVEVRLAEIWREILSIDKIGIHDSFLQMGGHSLNVMNLVAKVFQEFNVELPLGVIFEHPTIEELAKYIKGLKNEMCDHIEPIINSDFYQVSSAQRKIFISSQFEEIGTTYNLPKAVTVIGKLDRTRLKESLRKLVRRHEILRSSFKLNGGEPVQIIHENMDINIDFLSIRDDEVKDIVKKFIRPFNLSDAPLMRVCVLEISSDKNIILFDVHHIIVDGTSMGIIIQELSFLYDGKVLPKPTIQYKDFAAWQNKMLETDIVKKQEEYWKSMFYDKIPQLNLPLDYPRPQIDTHEGAKVYFELSKDVLEKLKKIALEVNGTLFMVLLSIYNILLAKYCNQQDIVVASVTAGRRNPDTDNMIGMFINNLIMRNKPESTKTFYEFLLEVKDNTIKALENQDYQVDNLINKLSINWKGSRAPFQDALFVLQNTKEAELNLRDAKVIPYELEFNISTNDLCLIAFEEDNKLQLFFEYYIAIFSKDTIVKMAKYYKRIVDIVTMDKGIEIGKIELIDKQERQEINSQLEQKESLIKINFDF